MGMVTEYTLAQLEAFARERVLDKADGLDYPDNFRVYVLGSGTSKARGYATQRRRGCCGSTDYLINVVPGVVALVGFNYGH